MMMWTSSASDPGLISAQDLKRATSKVPRDEFKGANIAHLANTLNQQLQKIARAGDLRLHRCEDLSLQALQETQQRIVSVAHPAFQQMYEDTNDNRRFRFTSPDELKATHSEQRSLVAEVPELEEIFRDSHCRESVMWYVHHLREQEKALLHSAGFELPSLPEQELRTDLALLSGDPRAEVAHNAYQDSLQCSTCHNSNSNFNWPSTAGVNQRTGEPVPEWPDAFDVEFVLEVVTEAGQPGLPNITNAPNNHFFYSYDRSNPQNSFALNRHETCPFFHTKSCDIYHQPDGIYLHLNPGQADNLCCLFQGGLETVPPYWVKWGDYVDTYEKGARIGGGQADLWEGFRSDRYIFGDAAQLDEHDYLVRAEDPTAMVRFHATLPPPNDHSHGYWHVLGDMNVAPQSASLFKRPDQCLPSCGVGTAHLHSAGRKPHPLMPWAGLKSDHFEGLREMLKVQAELQV
jgi:hypothetical protein